MDTSPVGREEFDALLESKTELVRNAKLALKEANDRIQIRDVRELIAKLDVIDLELANTDLDNLSKCSQLKDQAARLVEPFQNYAKQAA